MLLAVFYPQTIHTVCFRVLLIHIRQGCLDHDGTLDALFLHLASNLIGVRNGAVEIVGIGGASAAAVKPGKTVSAFFFCIDIAQLKLVLDFCISDSFCSGKC